MFKSILITIIIALTIKMASSYFKCTTDGFFPDKTDCWVYHICDGGTHSVRACEEDLFFNPKTGLCDWPMNVECKQSTTKFTTKYAITKTSKSSKSEKSTDEAAAAAGGTGGGGDKNASGEVVENSSVEQQSICAPEDYGYMPHPKDCRKYIYCQEGQSKVFTCQGGLLWKQAEGNCVWPLDSDCPSLLVKKTTSNSNLLGGGGGGGGGGGYNSQLPTSAQSLAALRELYGSIECPIDITGFLPNPYDCSAYHFCNAGKDQVILCEPGLVYRQEKQVCDWPVNSQCQNKCPASSTSPSSPASKDSVKYRFVDSKSCCRYNECVNGRLVPQLCQYPLLFDIYTKQCLDYSRVKCGIRKECISPCQYFTNEDTSLCEMVPQCVGKPHGVYLDQNRPNCQFFYTCRDNRVFNHTRCSGNLRFNQYEGRCMAPNLVQCTSAASSTFYFSLASQFFLLFSIFSSLFFNETRLNTRFFYLYI